MADKIKVLYLINSVCLFQTNSYIHAVHTPLYKTHFFPPIILPRSGASYTCYWNFSSLKITSNQEKLIPNADNFRHPVYGYVVAKLLIREVTVLFACT